MLDVFTKHASEQQYLPVTKKAYLNSLKHYCDFAMRDSPNNANQIVHTKQRVCFWITSYRKECGTHQQQRMDADLAKLVTPDQLSQFRRSKPVLAAIKVIGSTGDGLRTLGQEEYVNVRDYLMTEIALANANCSGVLANMTLKQLEDARVVDGQYVPSVSEHKTTLTHGATKTVLSPSLHHYLTVYSQYI